MFVQFVFVFAHTIQYITTTTTTTTTSLFVPLRITIEEKDNN